MNEPQFTPEQKQLVDRFEFSLSLLQEQDLLYSSFRKLLKEIPNDYELGYTIRKLFSE